LTFDSEGNPHLKQLTQQPKPQGAIALRQAVRERMPERNLMDILSRVQHWVNFARHFGPPSGSEPKLRDAVERYIITTKGLGCNLGPAQMAQHSRGRATARTLVRTNEQHITVSRLDAALCDVILEYSRFHLPYMWGTGQTAIADGTQFDLYENNLLAERHIRYGGYGGIAYHHISDTYIATKAISFLVACGKRSTL
jgi:hypothetical protein